MISRPVAFFDLTEGDLSEDIDATVERIVRMIEERSLEGRRADADPDESVAK